MAQAREIEQRIGKHKEMNRQLSEAMDGAVELAVLLARTVG